MSIDARIMTSLPAHPKTKKLIRRHGQAAGWNLICLFLFARANKPDGDFSGFTVEDIELASDWTGKDGEFVQALLDVGYLELRDGEYSIHDWTEHNPWSAGAELRSIKAKWNAAKRHHGEAEADRLVPEYRAMRKDLAPEKDATSNATSKDVAQEQQTTSNAPLPSPIPSPSPSKEQTPSAGDESPADPIWHTGLSFLVRKGIPKDQARKFLGKLKREAGDIQAAGLLARCESEDVTDPVPWLSAGAIKAKEQNRAPQVNTSLGASPQKVKTPEQEQSDRIDGLRHMAHLGNADAIAKLNQMGVSV